MDFKHFSHPHPLTHHQTPPQPAGGTLICSGCDLQIQNDTFHYTCWQCQFFLHDQCFRAPRSLSHPSHSSHPLSLIPYPTYPFGFFICNTCNLQGTGFSYSCPNCDFDLHVHCAHINIHNNNNNNNNVVPGIQNSHAAYPSLAFPSTLFPPSQNQNFGETNIPYQNNYPPSPAQFSNTQYPFMHDNVTNNIPNDCYPPSQGQNFLGNNFPNLNNYPPTQAQYYPLVPENVPYQPVSANTASSSTDNPVAAMTAGTTNLNNYPSTQAQYCPPMPENVSFQAVSSASGSNAYPAAAVTAGTTAPLSQPQGVKHSSHEHPLDLCEMKEKNVLCYGCEKQVSGLAYRCVNRDCKFSLHRECFGLPHELQHKSHKEHPLTLLMVPASKGNTACDGCLSTITDTSFSYRCSTCDFDLHASCAFLAETIKRDDHPHSLSLIHSIPDYKEEDEEHVPACDVCQDIVDVKNSWFYLCQECDFGTHLGCVDTKMPTKTEKTKEELLAAALIELQVLELKERLSKLNASFQVE